MRTAAAVMVLVGGTRHMVCIVCTSSMLVRARFPLTFAVVFMVLISGTSGGIYSYILMNVMPYLFCRNLCLFCPTYHGLCQDM